MSDPDRAKYEKKDRKDKVQRTRKDTGKPKTAVEKLAENLEGIIAQKKTNTALENEIYFNKNFYMEPLEISDNWKDKKRRLKQYFPDLTDKDLEYREGAENELIERVHKRLGIDRHNARKLILVS